jgi:hypothetical protein
MRRKNTYGKVSKGSGHLPNPSPEGPCPLLSLSNEALTRIATALSLSPTTHWADNHAQRLSSTRLACRQLEGPTTRVLYRRFALMPWQTYYPSRRLAYLVQGAYYLTQLDRRKHVRVLFVNRVHRAELKGINWVDARLADENWQYNIEDNKIIDWGNRFTTARNLLDLIYDSVGLVTTLDIFDSYFWEYWLRKVEETPAPNITRLCVGPSN